MKLASQIPSKNLLSQQRIFASLFLTHNASYQVLIPQGTIVEIRLRLNQSSFCSVDRIFDVNGCGPSFYDALNTSYGERVNIGVLCLLNKKTKNVQ